MLSGSLNTLDTTGPSLSSFKEKYGELDDVNSIDQDDIINQDKLILDGRTADVVLTHLKIYWCVSYVSPTTRKIRKFDQFLNYFVETIYA